jgi:hypothetical protein
MADELRIERSRWRGLYRLAGVSAMVIVVLLVGELFVYGIVQDPGSPEAVLELFRESPLVGLLFFDLLGMVSYLFFVPVMLAFYILLRRDNETMALVASVFFVVGVAVFFANNTGFAVLSLSKAYALAETDAEKTILLASCRTMIALFDVNAFMVSYVIVSTAWAMTGLAMLRSPLFGRSAGYSGFLAGAAAIVAEIFENTSQALVPVAIAFYFAAILCLIAWLFLGGRRLLGLGAGANAPADI